MDEQIDPRSTPPSGEASFVRGGPAFRIQQAVRLIRPNQWNLGRRITLLLIIGGLPLLLLTLLFHPAGLYSLLRDYRVHSRLLLSIPALLIGEVLMESRFRAVLGHIRKSGILDASDLAGLDSVIASLIRARDSLLPESVILLLAIVHTLTTYRGLVDTTPWLSYSSGGEIHLTAAGWYAVWVTSTIFQFLLGLAIWKWLLWTFFAFKLSRCDLKLFPTHPDEHGGLGFLGLTSAAFAPIAFSATAVIGATFRQDILYHSAHLMDFKLPAIFFVVFIALVALGPLAFFVPRLADLRRKGILEYGILGQLHTADFHEKWIAHRAGHENEFLKAPDSSSLADYGRAYEKIEEMNAFPADMGALYTLAGAIVIPALPTILAQVPIAVVVRDLLRAMR